MASISGIFATLLIGTAVSIFFAVRAAENARVASERERVATYQTYQARIGAAVAALAHHDVADAAGQLEAAPQALRGWEWQHLRSRLDDSTSVFRAAPGESLFLANRGEEIRIAALTRAGLRLTDLEGNVLFEHAFSAGSRSSRHPAMPAWNGLQLADCTGDTWAREPASARARPHRAGVSPLGDAGGCVRAPLDGPVGAHAYMVAGSTDLARVAVVWRGPERWDFALYDSHSGKTIAISAQDIGYTWAIAASPDSSRIATGGEDGIVRLWETSTGKLTTLCRGHRARSWAWGFAPIAGAWCRPRRMGQCGNGTSRQARKWGRRMNATREKLSPRLTAPTAIGSPREARIGRSASGERATART